MISLFKCFLICCKYIILCRKIKNSRSFLPFIWSTLNCVTPSDHGPLKLSIHFHKFFFSVSYMIFYMFQCHSPRSPHPLPLPQSPEDCSIHQCLFCCLIHRVIVTIFLNSIYMR